MCANWLAVHASFLNMRNLAESKRWPSLRHSTRASLLKDCVVHLPMIKTLPNNILS